MSHWSDLSCRPMSAAPVFTGLLLAAAGKLGEWLEKRPAAEKIFTDLRSDSAEAFGFRSRKPSWMFDEGAHGDGGGAAAVPAAARGLSGKLQYGCVPEERWALSG